MKMNRFPFKAATLAAALGATAWPAWAQPDVNNAPKADNPPNQPQRPARPDWRNMTPEQRDEFRFRQRDRMLRQFMQMGDITDANTQDEIVLYVTAEEKAREPLTEQYRKLVEALGAKAMNQPPVDDAALTTLLADFRTAVATDKERHQQALNALDAKIDFRKQPRVEGFLALLGYGDEALSPGGSLLTGGVMGGMMGGPGGALGDLLGGGRGGRRGGNPNGGPPAPAAPPLPRPPVVLPAAPPNA